MAMATSLCPRQQGKAAGDVQVQRRDADVAVPGRVPNLGQRASAGQGVADERVTPVVDGHLSGPTPHQVGPSLVVREKDPFLGAIAGTGIRLLRA